MESTLRMLRGFEQESETCLKASMLTPTQLVRLYSRSLVAISAYDTAIVQYCRDFFIQAGNKDMNFRHSICSQLKGPVSFAFLFAVYLDSERFKEAFSSEVGRGAPSLRPEGTQPTPNLYSDMVSEMKVQTSLEESAGDNKLRALRQQGKLTSQKAKEVDLVQYLFIKKNQTKVFGTEGLHRFFMAWLPKHLDAT